MPHPIRLTPADADRFAAFRREMLLDSPWAFGASPEDDRPVESIRASLALPENAILAVIADTGPEAGRLLATAGVRREEKRKRGHIAYIWGVYAAPPARGRGLGRAVVAAAVETARAWPGIECVELSVSDHTPAARRLYESLGFKPWGFEPDALRTGGRSFGEFHMRPPL